MLSCALFASAAEGAFGEKMEIDVVGDGPVTIVLDTEDKFRSEVHYRKPPKRKGRATGGSRNKSKGEESKGKKGEGKSKGGPGSAASTPIPSESGSSASSAAPVGGETCS